MGCVTSAAGCAEEPHPATIRGTAAAAAIRDKRLDAELDTAHLTSGALRAHDDTVLTAAVPDVVDDIEFSLEVGGALGAQCVPAVV